MTGNRWLCVTLSLVVTLLAAPGASAAFPGSNGKIVFEDDGILKTISPDGQGIADIPNTAGARNPAVSPNEERIAVDGITTFNFDGSDSKTLATGTQPAWSNDGTEIVYSSGTDLWILKADGSGTPRQLTSDPAFDGAPSWSPRGDLIAFVSGRSGNRQVWTVRPDGTGARQVTAIGDVEDQRPSWSPDGTKFVYAIDDGSIVDLYVTSADATPNPANDKRITVNGSSSVFNDAPAWSPDGTRIAFSSNRSGQREIVTVAAPNGGDERPVTNAGGRSPDWQAQKTPIVFVHGFAGARLFCGADELWLRLPSAPMDRLALSADGVTDAPGQCPTPIGPQRGQLLETAGGDIYGSTVNFLRDIGPAGSENYAWDWRKAPDVALAGLDEAVERARCGGTLPAGSSTCAQVSSQKVVIMAHSMGGLVTRWYLEDSARAAKVSRVLTVGTPYWGAAKAFFPLASGAETPGFSPLDLFLDDEDFKAWARNAAGEYFLWPSEAYGQWLSVKGRNPEAIADRAALLAYVTAQMGGNAQLLENALNGHAGALDGFESHGSDYRVIAGAGLPTINKVRWMPGSVPLLDRVEVTFSNGDSTVPIHSAVQGPAGTSNPLGDDVQIRYACNVAHVPLPGHPEVTRHFKDFLLSGADIASGLTSAPCPAVGASVEIFNIGLSANTSRAPARAGQAPANALTLDQAEQQDLADVIRVGAERLVVADADRPVVLKVSGKAFGIRGTALNDDTQGARTWWGPLNGEIEIRAGADVKVLQTGKELKSRGPDTQAPATYIDLTPAGRKLKLRPRVPGGGSGLLAVGSTNVAPVASVVVSARNVPKVVFTGVDAFGNASSARPLVAATRITRKRRRLGIRIACPAAIKRCKGSVTVKAGKKKVGRRAFSVRAGKSRTVTMKARRRGGKLVAAVRTGKRLESRLLVKR